MVHAGLSPRLVHVALDDRLQQWLGRFCVCVGNMVHIAVDGDITNNDITTTTVAEPVGSIDSFHAELIKHGLGRINLLVDLVPRNLTQAAIN